jgi:hypothetical protein
MLFIIRYFLFEDFCSDGQAATAVRSVRIPSVVKLPNILEIRYQLWDSDKGHGLISLSSDYISNIP